MQLYGKVNVQLNEHPEGGKILSLYNSTIVLQYYYRPECNNPLHQTPPEEGAAGSSVAMCSTAIRRQLRQRFAKVLNFFPLSSSHPGWLPPQYGEADHPVLQMWAALQRRGAAGPDQPLPHKVLHLQRSVTSLCP